MSERSYVIDDFIRAAESKETYMNSQVFSSNCAIVRFKNFYHLTIRWNESFVHWETEVSQLVSEGTQVKVSVRSAADILELIELGFNKFVNKKCKE